MIMENRKRNRLVEFDYSTPGAYFVTLCTKDRKKNLSTILPNGDQNLSHYGRVTESLIHEIPLKYPSVHIDKYVIMPDHIHLLIMIDSSNGVPPALSTVVGWFKYSLTKRCNQISGKAGEKILQRSYYDHIVRNQQDYDDIWTYIDNNPLNWLAKKSN